MYIYIYIHIYILSLIQAALCRACGRPSSICCSPFCAIVSSCVQQKKKKF